MNNYQKLSRDLQTIWSASQGCIVETRKSRPKVSPFLCWNFSHLFWLSFAQTICPWVFEDVWRVGQVWKSSLLLIVGNLALLWACGLLKVFFSGGGVGGEWRLDYTFEELGFVQNYLKSSLYLEWPDFSRIFKCWKAVLSASDQQLINLKKSSNLLLNWKS